MNKTITLLLLSDVFLVTGIGLIEPILAIFIKENLIGGTIFAAGLSSMIFLLTKSAIQLPFSRYVDSTENKKIWLLIGTFLVATVPFIYMAADHVYVIYLAQFIQGIGSGLAFPCWLGLWSRNLDRNHESFEWSLYSTITGLGTALTAAAGAALAEFVGFHYTFILVGLLSVSGAAILFGLEHKATKKKEKNRKLRDFFQERRKFVPDRLN